MLYYLFEYLESEFNLIGASVFRFISFRAGMAALISLLISVTFGKYLIGMLRKYQLGEKIRDLGLEGQMEKAGTPTMGGLIIIMAIVIPTLLFAQLENIYIILMLVTALSMGLIGFLDDYLKLKKKNKDGLAGKFKIFGQVTMGLVVGLVLVFHEDVTVREFTYKSVNGQTLSSFSDVKALLTTIPFIKDNELDYHEVFGFLGQFDWVLYVLLVIFIFTAVSNGANITDGVDGLAAGTSAIIALTLAIFAYVSGNVTFSQYLNVMFIPDSGELVIFCTALVGACIGFLWYNAYPAQVFMGDTGSLSLGGIIAVLAIVVRKELLIPIMCGIFLVENLSVLMQVSYFKYTRKRFGEGKRIFLMSPLHHHYQKKGIHEAKIVARFWTIGILLAIFSLVTLKLR